MRSLALFVTCAVVANGDTLARAQSSKAPAAAATALQARLRSSQAKDRVEAAIALRKTPALADAAARTALVKMLGDERTVPQPSDLAAPSAPHPGEGSLGRASAPGAGPPWPGARKPSPVPVTTAAAEAVVTLGLLGAPAVPEIYKALEAREAVVRRNAVRALASMGALATAPPLMGALSDADAETRDLAAPALVAIEDPAVTALLLEALKTPGKARPQVAWVLGRRRDALAGDALLAALKETDAALRAAAAEALGDLREKRAVEPLIAAVGDADAAVAGAAVGALGLLRDGRAVEPLLAALGSPHGVVCRRAAEALGRLKDSRAVDRLVGALGSADAGCRSEAAVALRILPDRRAIGALVPLLEDKDELVRVRALEALEAVTGQRLGAEAAPWKAWWAAEKQ